MVLEWYSLIVPNDDSPTRQPTGALVVVERSDGPVFEAKWRRGGRQVKRRVGPAWLEHGAGRQGWCPRRGRMPDGFLDEKRATVRMAELIAEHDAARARDRSAASASAGSGA